MYIATALIGVSLYWISLKKKSKPICVQMSYRKKTPFIKKSEGGRILCKKNPSNGLLINSLLFLIWIQQKRMNDSFPDPSKMS